MCWVGDRLGRLVCAFGEVKDARMGRKVGACFYGLRFLIILSAYPSPPSTAVGGIPRTGSTSRLDVLMLMIPYNLSTRARIPYAYQNPALQQSEPAPK